MKQKQFLKSEYEYYLSEKKIDLHKAITILLGCDPTEDCYQLDYNPDRKGRKNLFKLYLSKEYKDLCDFQKSIEKGSDSPGMFGDDYMHICERIEDYEEALRGYENLYNLISRYCTIGKLRLTNSQDKYPEDIKSFPNNQLFLRFCDLVELLVYDKIKLDCVLMEAINSNVPYASSENDIKTNIPPKVLSNQNSKIVVQAIAELVCQQNIPHLTMKDIAELKCFEKVLSSLKEVPHLEKYEIKTLKRWIKPVYDRYYPTPKKQSKQVLEEKDERGITVILKSPSK